MTAITNVTVTSIVHRVGRDRHTGADAPFSEIFFRFERDGTLLHALARVPWPLDDSQYTRAQEREAFIRRQNGAMQ